MRDVEAGLVLGTGWEPGRGQQPLELRLSPGWLLRPQEQCLEAGLVLAPQLRRDRA